MAKGKTRQRGLPDEVKISNQTKTNRKTALRVWDRYEEMKINRQENDDQKWDTWDRMARNIPAGAPPEDWMANVFVPYVQSTELTIISELTDQRPRWRLIPRKEEDEEKTDVLNAVTDYTLDKGNFDAEIFKFIYDKLHYGTAIWKEFYRQDRRTIREMKKDKDGKLKPERDWDKKDIKEYDDVYGGQIPLRSFYLDDKALNLEEARDCVERTIWDIDEFKTRYSKYKVSKKVQKYGFLKPINEKVVKDLMPGGDVTREAQFMPVSDIKDREVEVLEYWNKSRDEHAIVANGVTIVDEPIPYDHKQLPYVMDIAVPIHNSAYGMGIPALLEASQEEINTLHNMMIDESKLSIHKPILMGGNTFLDEDEYQLRPKGIIPVDDVSQARELATTGIAASNFKMFEEVKQTIVTASGLDVRFAQSATPSGADTATEVLSLQESSLRRVKLYQKLLMLKALPRIARLRTANIQQFYKDPLKVTEITGEGGQAVVDEITGRPKLKKEFRTIRIQKENETGFNFLEVTPEDIRAEVDVEVVPQSIQPMSQAVTLKRLNTLLQTILSFPPALELVDLPEILRQFFKNIDLPTHIVKKVVGPENNDLEQANEETTSMANGERIPPTQNPSLKHTAVHLAFIFELDENGRRTGGQTEQFQALQAANKELILKHVEGEQQQHASKGSIEAPSIGRSVNRQQGVGVQEQGDSGIGTETANQGI